MAIQRNNGFPRRYDSLLSNVSIMETKPVDWQPPYPEDQDQASLPSGTALFDHVRFKFQDGITTLNDLHRCIEQSGSAKIKSHTRGIDTLLESLVNMARWLVGFLENATQCRIDSPWTQSAMVGLRVQLHEYSWRVMKISMVLKHSRMRGARA